MYQHADEEVANGRKDFNNSIIYFTLDAGSTTYSITSSDIILDDNINEDMEEFILVLELDDDLDSEIVEFEDQFEGILVIRIRDDDGMLYSCLNSTLFFYVHKFRAKCIHSCYEFGVYASVQYSAGSVTICMN